MNSGYVWTEFENGITSDETMIEIERIVPHDMFISVFALNVLRQNGIVEL